MQNIYSLSLFTTAFSAGTEGGATWKTFVGRK